MLTKDIYTGIITNVSSGTCQLARRGVRAVQGTGLENQRSRKGSVGSNPTPSAIQITWSDTQAAQEDGLLNR
ncbi:MAG: hypothetical protein K0R78_3171 [Pelosinus sp.]|nr:hypothetical protein [Pelosinus sp.]